MKAIGIIGGLGPQTTANLYMQLVKLSESSGGESRAPVLIWSVPLSFQLEKEAILHGQSIERVEPYLIDGAKRLEKGGAELLVMPCNSLHIFISQLRRSVTIPVLSIVEETAKAIKHSGQHKVGLVGTQITIESNLYQETLAKYGIACVVSGTKEQLNVSRAIYKVVSHNRPPRGDPLYIALAQFQELGIRSVVLACTDLPLIVKNIPSSMRLIDTFQILIYAAAREAGLIQI